MKLGCVDAGEKLNAIEMIPGGNSLVTGGESGHVIIKSLCDLAIQYVLDLSDYGPIFCLSFTPPPLYVKSYKQFMLVGTFDGSITVVCSQPFIDDSHQQPPASQRNMDDSNTHYAYTQHQVVKTNDEKTWWKK